MRTRLLVMLAAASALLAVSATPALAVSRITNTLTANDLSISTGQKVRFTAKTIYGWEYTPNPYPSNFLTEINTAHFDKPVTTAASGLDGVWQYRSSGRYVKPCWQEWKGTFIVGTTQSRSISFTAKAKSAPKGSVKKHYHGQWDNYFDSCGIPDTLYTTHN